ncbi:conserved hypothetical protein [Rhodospirillaceae bacterium LM-1]|nr:conserved hypothetical protein [Rhodospirillaceae bacterium LM-1]
MVSAVLPVHSREVPLSILEPGNLQPSYARLVLVSSSQHLDAIDLAAPDQLVVSSDWLVWRRCLQAGAPCIHIEAMTYPWPRELGDPSNVHLHSCEWVYGEGTEDLTRFHGFSLGKQFIRQVSLFCLHFGRTLYALRRICQHFNPREIVLLDLRGPLDLFNPAAKRMLVGDVARSYGLHLVDRLDEPELSSLQFAEQSQGFFAKETEPLLRCLMRDIYAYIIDGLFLLRRPFGHRPANVLLIHNWNIVSALLDGHARHDVAPMLLARHVSKRPRFLWDCWCRGVTLAGTRRMRLTKSDHRELRGIVERLEAAWISPGDVMEEARREFIRSNIISSGWLETQALETKRFMDLFHRHRIARVIIGDTTSSIGHLVAEAARNAGSGCDELLNGMFVTTQRFPSRVGDKGSAPLVSRLLARGSGDLRWLAHTGASIPAALSGYPTAQTSRSSEIHFDNKGKALILPIYADSDDSLALLPNIISWLMETIALLNRRGCSAIRVKLHVGPPNLHYHLAAIENAELAAEVVKDNNFSHHVEWADFVIGPVNSGAWLETIAAGKPYFAILARPSLISREVLGNAQVVESIDELDAMLDSATAPDGRIVYEDFCSASAIPNPTGRVWDLVALAIRDNEPAG